MKWNHSKGMILLTTIVMISILTMIVASLLQSVMLYIRSANQAIRYQKVFHQLEAMTKNIDLSHSNCTVYNKNPNQLIAMLRMHQGCLVTDNQLSYEYLIEDLGNYPCLPIVIDKQHYSSRQWYVTVSTPELMLQWRLAQVGSLSDCKGITSKPIHAGVMSWRKIVSIT